MVHKGNGRSGEKSDDESHGLYVIVPSCESCSFRQKGF